MNRKTESIAVEAGASPMALHQWLLRKSKDRVKEFLCQRLHIEFNSVGLPLALARRMQPGKPIVLVDVGAFQGWFSRMVSQYCGIAKAILIEAMPERIALLRRDFPPPRHEVVCCAASDREGTTNFEIHQFEPASSMLPVLPDHKRLQGTVMQSGLRKVVECSTRTLDSITHQAALPGIDLLKIDVQGAEHLVLAGAVDTLARTRLVWIEVSFRPLYSGASRFHEIHEQFDALGFSLVDLEPGFRSQAGELLQADALFERREANAHV